MKIVKKAAIIIACLMCSATLFGCNFNKIEGEIAEERPSIFVRVEQTITHVVVYDRETKVMYVMSAGSYNGGNFTMLVNADGTPKLYKEK